MDKDTSIIEFYPTAAEILSKIPETTCIDCGRTFPNSSSCRFHRIKQHPENVELTSNEARLVSRSSEKRAIMAFYCPGKSCVAEKKWFEGWRHLKQHYFRSHAEKNLACDMCGFKTGLQKDLNYHRKARCAWVRAEKNKNRDPVKKEIRKRSEPSSKESEVVTSTPSTSTVFCQPMFFIINSQNADSIVETVKNSLNNADTEVMNMMSAEASTQVRMPYNGDVMNNMYTDTAPPPQPTSTSFATQYEEPVTFCERGTMMNDEEPLNYFSPPYGAEFGDMTPRIPKREQEFNYGNGPSTSSQPQTRSFGTMFENVTTCNTGTSMIDESSLEFFRDIETQTPNFMIPHDSTSGTTTDWQSWQQQGDI